MSITNICTVYTMTKTNDSHAAPALNTFPVPFSLEDFRKDIANVFLHHLRTVAWMTDAQTAESIVPGLATETDRHPLQWQADAEDVGLTYKRLQDTTLMKTLEFLYRYAFFGELDASADRMEDESIYTWTSALAYDAAHGRLALEWSDNGAFTDLAAERCLMVCELANARLTLDGGEAFYFKFGNYPKDSATGNGCLTIRQMALLAGMEEMSIRAAANKTQKRANPLETYPADGGTRIALSVAKAWLMSKGRYMPITVRWSAGEVDLEKKRFASSMELWHALKARQRMLQERTGQDVLAPTLTLLNLDSLLKFVNHHLMDEMMGRKIAEALQLPADLLVLRCKEIAAREVLAEIERELREALALTTEDSQA